MDRGQTPSKEALVESLLEHGMVMVTVDARRPGVDVPRSLQGDPSLRLNLSYRFGLRLEVGSWGIHADLTFGGVPHACKLPWQAIYQVFSHASQDHYLFPADLPEDLAEALETEQAETPPPARPRLAVVPSETNGERGSAGDEVRPVPAREPAPGEDGEGDRPPPKPPGPGRGHLRRIK